MEDADAKERDDALLERHRPILRFDPQYDYRVLAADSAVENPGNILRRFDGEVIARAGGQPPLSFALLGAYPPDLAPRADDSIAMGPDHIGDARRMESDPDLNGRLYGRVVADGSRTFLQYWFWLYYNPKNLLGVGKHEGDWEMVQVGIGASGEPEVATYAQHDSGEARRWRPGEIEVWAADPRRPVVYVAPLSHASYFEPYTHPYVLGIDHPYAGGPAADLPVVGFGPWIGWGGHWGSIDRRIARGLGGGPRSPSRQGIKWERPGAWHDRMSRRRWRSVIGRAMHRAGSLTYPAAPRISVRGIEDGRVRVAWELQGAGVRRERHLQITLHDRHLVIASRIVQDAAGRGETSLPVPVARTATTVMASAYNRLRQRGDVVQAPVGP